MNALKLSLLVVGVVLLRPSITASQTAGEGRALERRGLYEEAGVVYRSVLVNDPVNVEAWLGLERVMAQLDRLETLIPVLDSTVQSNPRDDFVREMVLRVWADLGRPDSVAAAARRWIEAFPGEPEPYRQWAYLLDRKGQREDALAILLEGRASLGEGALAPEMAQLLGAADQWVASAQEWSLALGSDETQVAAASFALRRAPETERENVLDIFLTPESDLVVQRLGAELLVAWDRPEEGWTHLSGALPNGRKEAASELRLFADRVSRLQTREGARARGFALERLADLVDRAESEQARLEAAQAFADAGDLGGARRMLERLEVTAGSTPKDAAAAMATLIRVTVESGELEEAEARLESWEDRMRPADVIRLRERLGWSWVLSGELDRAERVLAGDSSINTLALLGWVALYEGRLRAASEYFRAAGPYAQTRSDATERTVILALLQGIEPDSVPALGEALLSLARADTVDAIDKLDVVARSLPTEGGRSPLLSFAGSLASKSGDLQRGEALFLEALEADSTGPSAPTTEYALGVVLVRAGQEEAAASRLEHLILNHPGSAIVPEARRLLDQVRGAIPR